MTVKQLEAIKKLYTTWNGRLLISTHVNSETVHPAVVPGLVTLGYARVEYHEVGGGSHPEVKRFLVVSNRICPEASHLRSDCGYGG